MNGTTPRGMFPIFSPPFPPNGADISCFFGPSGCYCLQAIV
ncbi:hypothetical protein TSMEX_005949 [Taenia solium]|eukprot:TsM_000583200 transcript=TsM_000583200 gene=TsM_000583200